MKADYLRIGTGCTVGNLAVVLYGTQMLRGSTLGPLSLLMKGETLPAASNWIGIPSEPKEALPPAVSARS
jgi:carbonic anhydrase/acetyltransferase-like protein (isoleucine patch superfamily)